MKVLKTNINKITMEVANRVKDMGLNVTVSYSHKTRSRYIDMKIENKLLYDMARAVKTERGFYGV